MCLQRALSLSLSSVRRRRRASLHMQSEIFQIRKTHEQQQQQRKFFNLKIFTQKLSILLLHSLYQQNFEKFATTSDSRPPLRSINRRRRPSQSITTTDRIDDIGIFFKISAKQQQQQQNFSPVFASLILPLIFYVVTQNRFFFLFCFFKSTVHWSVGR